MSEGTKILIAYDGSEYADAALDDLRRAGLPRTVEAMVLTVADVFVPPPIQEEANDTFPPELPAVRRAHERAKRKLQEAELLAKQASERIKKDFPEWKVSHAAVADSPAWAVIFKAAEWESDLIVVGSHGESGLAGRLILGSVSQRVLYEAHCSVRVGRSRQKANHAPPRLIIGIDGSQYSRTAVQAVAKRSWPEGTEVRLVAVVDTVIAVATNLLQPSEVKWIEVDDEGNWDQVQQIFDPEAERLRSTGLDVAIAIRRGNPTKQLLEEAETWGADCIFLGAKGVRGIERLLLGSVSAAVAARAHCSVEIVRPRESART